MANFLQRKIVKAISKANSSTSAVSYLNRRNNGERNELPFVNIVNEKDQLFNAINSRIINGNSFNYASKDNKKNSAYSWYRTTMNRLYPVTSVMLTFLPSRELCSSNTTDDVTISNTIEYLNEKSNLSVSSKSIIIDDSDSTLKSNFINKNIVAVEPLVDSSLQTATEDFNEGDDHIACVL